MKVIVFRILGTDSHLNASFKLARTLQTKGYEVIYLVDHGFERVIINQGFQFFKIPEKYDYRSFGKKSKGIGKILELYRLKKRFESHFLEGDLFDEVVEMKNPLLIVLDQSFIYNSVYLLEKNIPFITVSTKVCQDKIEGIPPFTSYWLPHRRSIFFDLKVELIWLIHFIRKRIKYIKDHICYNSSSKYLLSKRYAKIHGLDISNINDFRVSHFGWKNIPELILSPRHFDFPRSIPPNQIYIGPIVDTKRENDEVELKLFREIFQKERKTVYCSMGGYDVKYRSERINFFLKLIKIFSFKEELQLIIGTGKDIDPLGFKPLPKNIYLFQYVPQLYLIKNSDLVITHGGMQTITECILAETPMLVYPLNPNLDQNGNSARVVYHRIGLRGSLRKESLKLTEKKIGDMLKRSSFFKRSLRVLKNRMINSGDFEKGIEFIEKYIYSLKV